MRIVVTGAGGFVGRALARRLRALDHDVLATDLTITQGLAGQIGDPALLERLFAGPVDAVFHLATVAGGAAETAPDHAWQVNVAATRALIDAAARHRPRFVYASSIAVLGDDLPARVTDGMPPAPRMLYGAHKAMMEQWIACQSRRGALDGLSLRLPGIVARPKAPSGMISAFMSDLFHALREGAPFTLPVSPDATMWLLSRPAVVDAMVHALSLPAIPAPRCLTLPALRVRMADLVAAIARATGGDPALIRHAPQAAIEAGFGRLPELSTAMADGLGFRHDGSLPALVEAVLADIQEEEER